MEDYGGVGDEGSGAASTRAFEGIWEVDGGVKVLRIEGRVRLGRVGRIGSSSRLGGRRRFGGARLEAGGGRKRERTHVDFSFWFSFAALFSLSIRFLALVVWSSAFPFL